MASILVRLAVAAFFLTALQTGGGMLVTLAGFTLPSPPSNPIMWMALDNAVVVALLARIAFRSTERGWALAGTLSLLLFGVATFNSLIEAQYFGFFGWTLTLALLGTELLQTLVFAPVLVLLLRAPLGRIASNGWTPPWRARLTAIRLLMGGIAYIVTYLAAGSIVFPYIRDFYATKPMPNPLTLIAFQTFVRGPIFVVLLFAGIRSLRVPRGEAVVIAGALLSVIGGVGLIIPNGFFPDYVRWFHFFEVTISNFAYGALVGWLLTRPAGVVEPGPTGEPGRLAPQSR